MSKIFNRHPKLTAWLAGLWLVILCCDSRTVSAQPIRIHPENEHWFEWRGEPLALITSAEHYGAVINSEFDYERYLEALARDGMNYTRIFAGSYVEPQGAFNIERNTLAPAQGAFLAPWRRSAEPGYAGGGNKFDLSQFSDEYLQRLKSFLAAAEQRGIIVELTIFCSTYSDKQWAVHPFNPNNNIQATPVPDWKLINSDQSPSRIVEYQVALTRWLVRELNAFDNLFYEIQNEPWADNHSLGDYVNPLMFKTAKWANQVEITAPRSIHWQQIIADAIEEEEATLEKRHLIAQNVANFQFAIREEDLVRQAGLVNFHYAYPAAVEWNRGLGRLIGFDESGFAGRDDRTYLRQAWNFVMSGGGLFNNLDYSFSVGFEDGSNTESAAPGGGSEELRRQLMILSQFLHGFTLEQLRPDHSAVVRSEGVVARTLSWPDKEYAIYLQGRAPARLKLSLAPGDYHVSWIQTETEEVVAEIATVSDDGVLELVSPDFEDSIAVGIRRQ